MTFPIHSGQRKRPISSRQIESFEKRRTGTKAQREAAMQLYAPVPNDIAPSSMCPGTCWNPERCAIRGKCDYAGG